MVMTMAHDANGFYGLDTDQCRGKAQQMQGQGQQMNGLMQNIQGMLDSVIWRGGNAERFRGNWDGTLRPKMAESAEQMQTHGRELRRRADMQDQASG